MIAKKNNFHHKLMFNNIELRDLKKVKIFLNKENIILTQSKKVLEFEKKWSKWLGVKYSIFVNSGSSANYLTMLALKIIHGEKGEVIVPSLTWISDIVSVINNGFKPVFVDINLDNLCMDETHLLKSLTKKTKAVFITHAQGFNGLSENLLNVLKKRKILLIEDVCESHGATFRGRKLGSFGEISNFSFYYAHHLSTIEGGMICTNNKKIYELARMLRAHGMVRESGNKKFENKPGQLSGGEQQRVAVARALVNNPSIVLADEPTGNLDSTNANDLHQLFINLRGEFHQTFLIVTHNQDLAKKSDRILQMKDGKMEL
jgi:CDP-6-deoxy-D-xylo-4-hexulose-3-dehydrase